ncbi:hypothetical protein os4_30750 [Comamonadaceae bacterium OS-4]|nr:hypothetical protein os4_30750 [Comamonadaceae bacterium OS-4]
MTNKHKWLFTAISLVLVFVGLLAIVTKTHTGSSKYTGIWTMVGDDAIWFGKTCLLLAVLPLIVWLPKPWVGYGVAAWWLGLMAWLFVPFVLR